MFRQTKECVYYILIFLPNGENQGQFEGVREIRDDKLLSIISQ